MKMSFQCYCPHVTHSVKLHKKYHHFTSSLKRVYDAGTWQLPKWPHCTSAETIVIYYLLVDLIWINSVYFGRQCQVHTQIFQQKIFCTLHGIVISVLPERTWCTGIACSLCPVLWPAETLGHHMYAFPKSFQQKWELKASHHHNGSCIFIPRGLLKASHTQTTGYMSSSANGGLPFPPPGEAMEMVWDMFLGQTRNGEKAVRRRQGKAMGWLVEAWAELLDFVMGADAQQITFTAGQLLLSALEEAF